MLDPEVVEQIRWLLRQGKLSQRKIAQKMGVSRGTVQAIAHGKRTDSGQRHKVKSSGFVAPSGPAVRCRGCGGMVRMPCLLCHVREVITTRTLAKHHRGPRHDDARRLPFPTRQHERRSKGEDR